MVRTPFRSPSDSDVLVAWILGNNEASERRMWLIRLVRVLNMARGH